MQRSLTVGHRSDFRNRQLQKCLLAHQRHETSLIQISLELRGRMARSSPGRKQTAALNS
jgi:hypothetical protein